MSTILDALKKSEQERKRSHLPTLSDMPTPQEPPRWPWGLIAILSLLLAVALGVLMSRWWLSADTAAPARSIQPEAPAIADSLSLPATVDADVVVNVVSYSDIPAQRFVMLDGKMYRENDFVRAGLKVQEIRPNAVVLNLRGELLTRTP